MLLVRPRHRGGRRPERGGTEPPDLVAPGPRGAGAGHRLRRACSPPSLRPTGADQWFSRRARAAAAAGATPTTRTGAGRPRLRPARRTGALRRRLPAAADARGLTGRAQRAGRRDGGPRGTAAQGAVPRPNLVVGGGEPWAEDGWRAAARRRHQVPGGQGVRPVRDDDDRRATAVRRKEPRGHAGPHRRFDGEMWFGMNLVPALARRHAAGRRRGRGPRRGADHRRSPALSDRHARMTGRRRRTPSRNQPGTR